MAQYELSIGGAVETVRVEERDGSYLITVGDRTYEVDARRVAPDRLSFLLDGRSLTAHIARDGDDRIVAIDGRVWTVGPPERSGGGGAAGSADADGRITTPMPGKVVAVKASAGDTVSEGDTLVVVEAMKMEHELRAPFDGRVTVLDAEVGANVQYGDVVAEVERGE